ncbi:unnamed protein product [Mytilus edulis]|uniref:Uncharacterized protein n=2 Tax=Mytilus edulis TaxID=6550 RepID=A0A8S3UPZ1_MYTED|nr:unnamed protein product [Mytilus edulis]
MNSVNLKIDMLLDSTYNKTLLFFDRLEDILTIATLQTNSNYKPKEITTNSKQKQSNEKIQLSAPLTVEGSYKKLKMIHEETNLRINQKRNKTSITFSWDIHPVSNKQIISINNKGGVNQNQISRNKSLQFLMGLQAKSCTDIRLPPLEGTKINKLNPPNRLPLKGRDVTENTWDIRNLENDRNRLINHSTLKGGYISKQSTCIESFKPKTQVKQRLSSQLINRHLKEPTLISKVYNSMSSLRLDNRHDMAANDHVRHHIKRQQQWIRSDQVKNWSRSPLNRVKKQTYPNSTSSGQKSDVISGNSDESLHTASSSSEQQNVIDYEYDEERKEAIEKCMKWMNDLPTKFSGLHILDPAKS